MPEITEVSWLPLKKNTDNHPAIAELKKSGDALLAQAGLKHSYHGKPFEVPDSVEMVNVWASEQAYKDAKDSALATEAWKQMQEIIDWSDPARQPHRSTVIFNTPFSVVAAAPVVAMTASFLPVDVDTAALEKTFAKITSGGGKPDGFIAGTSGWVVEEVEDYPKMKGKKAKVFVSASGWESLEKNKEAHEANADMFKELEKFTDLWELHHTTFEKHK